MSDVEVTPCIRVTLPLDVGEWLYSFLRGRGPERIEDDEVEKLETAVLAIDDAIVEVMED